MLSGQYSGGGDATRSLPSIGSLGGVAPLPGPVRRSSFFGFAALNPFYGGASAHAAEGDSVAYCASSGGVGWVERSKTHRMNQRRRGAGWQQWGCGMNTDDSRIIARFQRLTTQLLVQKRLGQWHPELLDELERTSLELEQRGLKKSPEYRNAMSRVYQQARWLAECSRLSSAGIDQAPAGDKADEVIE